MKTHYRRIVTYGMLAALLSLVVVAFCGGTAQAMQGGSQYSYSCDRCHKMPPLDSATALKDPSTGAVPGNHQGHASSAVNSCAKCHGDAVTSYTTGHRNKAIELRGTLGYSRGFINQTSVPPNPLGSCSAATCHSDGKGHLTATLAWGRALFQSPADCSQCHNIAPATGSHPVSGSKHAAYYGFGTGSCVKCHADHTAENKPFAHATSAGGRGIDVHFTASPNSGGTFAGNQCSNLYCHSNGRGGAPNITPTWGGTLDCAGCHGDASSLASNAHQKHVIGKGYACDTCHASTVSGSSTITNKILHDDGIVEVAGASVTYTSGTKTCATACHGNGTPAWNSTSSGGCGTCHSALSTTANGLIATNAHTTHFTALYGPHYDPATSNSCAVCHIYPSDTAPTHVNGTVELAAGFSKSGTCSTCHRQTTNWVGGRVSCESCHTATSGPLSVIGGITAPDKTLAATAGHGKSGIGQVCTACHDNTSNHIGVTGGTKRLLSGLTGSTNAECNFCHQNPAKVTPQHLGMQPHVGFANTCAACHDPHGTINSNMVQTVMSSTTVSFSGTNYVNPQGTGVCQACHTATIYYKKNVAEANHPDSGCLDCHAHNAKSGTAFEPNRACDSCHGYPPAPRSVTSAVAFGVMGNWSSARFEDYSGGGGAHIVAQHVSPTIKPSDGWTPCLTCHNGGAVTHAKVIPVRSHVENVKVLVDPQYRFSNDSFISYTGAKFVSGGANKTGSCFNVSCHMKPSPKWSIER